MVLHATDRHDTGREGESSRHTSDWLPALDTLDQLTLRCFLVSARCGSFAQAARSLNLSSSVLRKLLLKLEAQVGGALFFFRGTQLSLSNRGQVLHEHLVGVGGVPSALQAPAFDAPPVRLAVAEVLLHDVLGRDLIAYIRHNAGIRLQVITLMGDSDWEGLNADIVLGLRCQGQTLPTLRYATSEPQLLASVQYSVYMAKRYCREGARPDSFAQLNDYMLVQLQHEATLPALEPWNRLIASRQAGVTVVPTYELLRQLVQSSACIGLMPHYVCHVDRTLTLLPDLFERPMQRQVWLLQDLQTRSKEAVHAIVELIHGAFAERKDWFWTLDPMRFPSRLL